MDQETKHGIPIINVRYCSRNDMFVRTIVCLDILYVSTPTVVMLIDPRVTTIECDYTKSFHIANPLIELHRRRLLCCIWVFTKWDKFKIRTNSLLQFFEMLY